MAKKTTTKKNKFQIILLCDNNIKYGSMVALRVAYNNSRGRNYQLLTGPYVKQGEYLFTLRAIDIIISKMVKDGYQKAHIELMTPFPKLIETVRRWYLSKDRTAKWLQFHLRGVIGANLPFTQDFLEKCMTMGKSLSSCQNVILTHMNKRLSAYKSIKKFLSFKQGLRSQHSLAELMSGKIPVDWKDVPIEWVKGADPTLLKQMNRKGVHSVYDLLTYYPYRYKNDPVRISLKTPESKVPQLRNGQKVVIKGRRGDIRVKPCRNGALLLRLYITVAGLPKKIGVSIFANPEKQGQDTVKNFEQMLLKYHYLKVSGTYSQKWTSMTTNFGSDEIKGYDPNAYTAQISGQYHISQGMEQDDVRKLVEHAYVQFHNNIPNVLPSYIRQQYDLWDDRTAIGELQFPADLPHLKKAHRTEAFRELLSYQVRLQWLKVTRKRNLGFKVTYNDKLKRVLSKFNQSLPFELTDDQKESVKDILVDLDNNYQMNRLLQGDVGSGKTVVAAFGILAAIAAGYQTAIMVPTSVLARQHFQTFTNFFKGFGVKIALLIGETPTRKKHQVLKKLRKGEIDLAVGTEALFQKSTRYKKLGLVVIDEQHRFGVKQREALVDKTEGANVLSMTATPIPRTLAITTYGDMDISIIRHLPKGRKPVITKWMKKANTHDLKSLICKILAHGGQAFVVARLKAPTKHSKKGVSDAKHVSKALRAALAPRFKVGELDGGMDEDIKDKILADFQAKKFQVLVATTVVEVGVDISDATLMVILNAERYGLAQLHQLRGRVGRSNRQAYCILVAKPNNKVGVQRMLVMEHTTDGFKVARADSKIRGTGNIFGSNQSGLPEFKVANLNKPEDQDILEQAQSEAIKLVRQQTSNI